MNGSKAGRILGIGGVFFKARNRPALLAWYRDVLGLDLPQEEESWGVMFPAGAMAMVKGAGSVWSPFAADSDYFAPSTKEFMINFCVDDLDAVLERLERHGVTPSWRDDEDPNGRFAHILDPEGLKLELWQPPE
jgi:predicted enzyme related to lactoylglutathione lyase